MAATASPVRWRWLVVPGGFTNHPLNIAETAGTLRVDMRAIIQSLGALGLDVRRDVGSPGSPDFPLNRSHRVLKAITNQPLRLRALLENRHAHFRANDCFAGGRMKIRHVAFRCCAELKAVQ